MSWTIVGAAAGAAIGSAGGPAGALKGAEIGISIGSIIDALTMRPPQAGDRRYSTVSYGTPIQRVWGAGRVDTAVIWVLRNSDGTYMTENDEGNKLKGGGVQQHYFATYGLLVAQTGFTCPDGTQIERPLTIDRIRMADIIAYSGADAIPINNWVSSTTYNFSDYVKGSDGYYYASIADGNTNNDPSANSNPLWWTQISTGSNISFVQHPGPSESCFTMAVDSTIATYDGMSVTQAYRDLTYLLISNQDFYQVGNTFPTNISVECHTATLYDSDVLSDLARLSGLSTSDFDFSAASTNVCAGFVQTSRAAAKDILTNFLIAKGYDLIEVDGKVKVVKRGGAIVASIPASDMGATLDVMQGKDLLPFSMLADRRELHSRINVRYMDPAQDYRTVEIGATWGAALMDNPWSFDSGLILGADAAAQLANYLLDVEWLEEGREFGPISLTGKYGYLAPADPVSMYLEGVLTRFRITRINWQPGLVNFWCTRDEPDTLNQIAVGDSGTANAVNTGTNTPFPLLFVFAVASPSADLTANFATYDGFYVWAHGPRDFTGYIGTVYYSTSSSFTNPVNAGTVPCVSTLGTVSPTFTSGVGALLTNGAAAGYETSDYTDVYTAINEIYMPAYDVTKDVATAGANNALIGGEWVGVVNVTVGSSPGGYVSHGLKVGPGLIRGLNGSPTTGHARNEIFAMAPSASQTVKIKVDPSLVGATIYVKVLSPGQALTDVAAQSVLISQATSPYTTNGPPVNPTSITVSDPSYSGANETLTYTAVYGTTPPAGQLLNWQYSTDAGSTWSTAVQTGTAYTPPAFTSGTMEVRAEAQTVDGRTASGYTTSSNTSYVAPSSSTPFGEVPSGTVNGTNTVFTLSHTPLSNTLSLTANGLVQTPTTQYTLSGATITFVTAPAVSTSLYANYSY